MQLTNEKLYELCRKYGSAARLWRQRFIGLLPEVNRRRLYEEKGFSSIFEFAAKLCGLSVEQVKLLPQKALETLVRDEKYVRQSEESVPQSGLPIHMWGGMRAQTSFDPARGEATKQSTSGLQLSPEVQAKLLELQNKGLDVDELLLEFLQDRERKIALYKEWLAINEIEAKPEMEGEIARPGVSRYINVATERLLKEEYGIKCSIENCTKLSEQIHHTQRFGLSKNNDPHFLAPLCKAHHQIAHSIDVKFHRVRERALGRDVDTSNWEVPISTSSASI